MTEKEKQLFAYILGYFEDEGYPPTFQEMADKMDVGITRIAELVASLNKKKYLIKRKTRSYRNYEPREGTNYGKHI